ncbi:unnamed protein product [Polarella glacialis]|uniref:AD domain-containing protein n=1 Tax=Polarella glacialis TaxID=89957 RepID=A0A813GWG8_POLGL|nr:unnamed protein product [Polarella glacialis]
MATALLPPGPANSFLGSQVKILTTTGTEFHGELFCYDLKTTNSLVLRNLRSDGSISYKWIRSTAVSKVQAQPAQGGSSSSALPAVNLLRAKEGALAAESDAAKLAKKWQAGVSEEALAVFEAILKTMPCEWDGEDIVCAGVRIAKPYKPETCSCGPEGDEASLERVRKVLRGEQEVQSRETGSSSSQPPVDAASETATRAE